MEHTSSSPADAWNNSTTGSSEDATLQLYIARIRDLALSVVYVTMGTVGILDNLFVVITFALFIKITDKVFDDLKIITQRVRQFASL